MRFVCAGIVVALGFACSGPANSDKRIPAGAAKPSDTMTVDTTVEMKVDTSVDKLVGLAPEVAVTMAPGVAVPMPPPVALPLPPGVAVRSTADTATKAATPDELTSLASTLMIPVEGVVASQLRDSYSEPRTGHTHEALDIMAPRGTRVFSATDGRVLKLYNSVAGGTMVYAADASDRFILMYGHLDRYAEGLAEKMSLKRGQLLGYVGSTGNVPPGAPHLHFAIARGHPSVAWWKGAPVNPYLLFVPPLAPNPADMQTHRTPSVPKP